ncbi:hypothetical protein A2V82_16505 [candidate division KSB1 bacterium RBG_16_48_16]|nr:MAG: hypothetical protein A2V82_16505 [candidate division KSB1 bacterium RBG_16_48_16]
MSKRFLKTALNFELPLDGSVPEWIELIPAGQSVVGRDGRAWVNDNPQGIVSAFAGNKAPIPVDVEHATEIKAPGGDAAPAMAWVEKEEVREGGSIWGEVTWTPKGQEMVANREYRYISPVLIYEKATGRIVGISSVGLTNKPNLYLNALNRESNQKEEIAMDLKALLAALGLPETATLEQALNAVGKLKGDLTTALNRVETPSLDKYVPRADYDAAVGKAANAEQKGRERDAADLDTAINTEIDGALKAGKITPATAEYHKAQCRQDGGLDRFKQFVTAAPVVADASGLDGKKPGETTTALNAEEAKIAAMFGNSVEDIKKYGKG